jgi:putative DNA primase/helicase
MSSLLPLENIQSGFPEIKPLPEPLLPVEPFDYRLLPDGPLSIHIQDIAERMQCPADYVAVAFMTTLSAVIGRSHQIMPKKYDDWTVVVNLWGLILGRPSVLKTPAVAEATRHLMRAEVEAKEKFEKELDTYKKDAVFEEVSQKANQEEVKKLIKAKKGAEARDLLDKADADIQPPVRKRLITNDTTVEKLGELMNENPNGLLGFRDEMSGFLKTIDSEQRPNDRAFYLEGFNGTGSYRYDRIGRGTVDIDHMIISLLGTIQPGRYAAYIAQAIKQGHGDDGLAQRFQLAVYPDEPTSWVNIDRYPNTEAKNAVFLIFDNLIQKADIEEPIILKFTEDAQQLFNDWRYDLENNKLRNQDDHPALTSHLAKYRSLLPSLALIIHMVECHESDTIQAVPKSAVIKACCWCEYLESHARRIYSAATNNPIQIAKLILQKIKRRKLESGFSSRDVRRKNWTGLTVTEEIKQGLDVLVDHGYLNELVLETGGRPSIVYNINPEIYKEADHG